MVLRLRMHGAILPHPIHVRGLVLNKHKDNIIIALSVPNESVCLPTFKSFVT